MSVAASSDTWALVRAAYCDTTESVAKICARLGVNEKELYRRLDTQGWGRRSAKPGFVDPFKRAKSGAVVDLSQQAAPMDDPAAFGPVATEAGPAKKRGPRMRGNVPAKPRKRLSAGQKLTKAALALRLYNALDLKLSQLEKLMADGIENSTIDQGRQTRAISQLIKAFERVTEYDPDLLKSASVAGLGPNAVAGSACATGSATDATPGAAHASCASAPNTDAAPGTEQRRREIAERLERIIAKRNAAAGSGGA